MTISAELARLFAIADRFLSESRREHSEAEGRFGPPRHEGSFDTCREYLCLTARDYLAWKKGSPS